MTDAHHVFAYRPDIDGLRAVAVLAVVFYHLGIGPFSGGFVGVDVFFVISGYLITAIIQREIGHERFTFASFYERRIRRLAPALFAVLMVVLVVGAWLLLPTDLIFLGKSTLATLLFGSNFFFWHHSGYFDSSSEINPLLHMWSLAVEEQFYIGLPILLLLVHRFARAHLHWILVSCALLSFAGCLLIQPSRPTATFYLSPFRAWELLVGAILAVGAVPAVKTNLLREVLSGFALLVLLASLLWINAGVEFPGWQAAFPVLATGILLHTGDGAKSFAHRVLSLRPLVFIGLISYSLYLWHWPLLVYVKYENALAPLGSVRWIVLAVALVLAWASYQWIERPFRRNRGAQIHSRARVFGVAGITACVPLMLALGIKFDHGLQFRVSSAVAAIDALRVTPVSYENCDERSPQTTLCRVGDPIANPSVLLWGDSHAMAWAPALDAVLRSRGEAAYIAVNSACPPLLGVVNPADMGCHDYNDKMHTWIVEHRPAVIFMVASWCSYSMPNGKYTLQDDTGYIGNMTVFPRAFDRTVDEVISQTAKLIVIGPTPGAPSGVLPRVALGLRGLSGMPAPISAVVARENSAYFWRVAGKFSGTKNIVLVDPSPWFCDQGSCRYLLDGHIPLYRDDGHLNEAGAHFLVPRLAIVMRHELGANGESNSIESIDSAGLKDGNGAVAPGSEGNQAFMRSTTKAVSQ